MSEEYHRKKQGWNPGKRIPFAAKSGEGSPRARGTHMLDARREKNRMKYLIGTNVRRTDATKDSPEKASMPGCDYEQGMIVKIRAFNPFAGKKVNNPYQVQWYRKGGAVMEWMTEDEITQDGPGVGPYLEQWKANNPDWKEEGNGTENP